MNNDLFNSLIHKLNVKQCFLLWTTWNEHAVVYFWVQFVVFGLLVFFEAFFLFEHRGFDSQFAVFDEHLKLFVNWDDLAVFVFDDSRRFLPFHNP